MSKRALLLLGIVLLLAGCRRGTPVAGRALPTAETPSPAANTATPLPTPQPRATASPTALPTATVTPSPSPLPTATATPDPYAGLTVVDLRSRAYGGGVVEVERTLGSTDVFTRSLITYPSDGLTIYGFMNVPVGEGPFPVAIVLHGYIDPAVYDTLAYTTRYADALARAGYLVLHPNLRGYPPSDTGPNPFRIGMAVDVLNLLAIIRDEAGRPGPFERANAEAIALMGHSMGGGITWRVLTIDRGVGAAVLYGSMHPDERENLAWRLRRTGVQRSGFEMDTPEQDLLRISPASFLGEIDTPLSIHHSVDDETVPYEWSEELATRMGGLGKTVELYLYENTPHTFRGEADQLFMQRMIRFFDAYLRPPSD